MGALFLVGVPALKNVCARACIARTQSATTPNKYLSIQNMDLYIIDKY